MVKTSPSNEAKTLMPSHLLLSLPGVELAPQHPFVVVEFNSKLDITYISANIQRFTSHKASHYLGKTLSKLIAEPSAETIQEFIKDYLPTGSPGILPCRIHQTDEKILSGELRLEVTEDHSGQWDSAVGVITLFPDHENAMTPQYSILSAIADRMPDVVYVYDLLKDELIYINAVVEKTFGTPAAEVLTRKVSPGDFVHPEDRTQWDELVQTVVSENSDRLYEYEFRLLHQAGYYIASHIRIKIFSRTADGLPHTLIGSLRDMTVEKAQVQREVEASAERERLHFLSQFIRSISHDFRTPLSIINSSAYFLVRKDDMEERRARAGMIEKQVSRLEGMLDQVALSIHLHIPEWYTFAPVAIQSIIEEVIAENDNPKNVPVENHIPADAPLLRGDIVFLKLALDELYKNSLQYTTGEGFIRFEMSSDSDTAIISVIDTGTGIEAEKIDHIFEYYFRADPARSLASGHQHTGLGLAIVKKIIDIHRGHIRVESQYGEGTRFIITLPLWQPVPES
jgi:PAS domain S-box-containing protein